MRKTNGTYFTTSRSQDFFVQKATFFALVFGCFAPVEGAPKSYLALSRSLISNPLISFFQLPYTRLSCCICSLRSISSCSCNSQLCPKTKKIIQSSLTHVVPGTNQLVFVLFANDKSIVTRMAPSAVKIESHDSRGTVDVQFFGDFVQSWH